MAFPTIADADTQSGTVTSNSNSWTLTWPTNIAAGDLIIALVGVDGNPVATWPANWADAAVNQGAAALTYAKYKAAGGESGTFTLGLSASEQGGWRVFRIPAASWEGTLGTQFQNSSTNGAVAAISFTTGTSSTPNPPNLDPINWATEDTLWIAACGVDTSRTISVYPLADRNTANVSGGAGGATLGVCTMEDAVSSKDPGTFTISASDDWATTTIAIRPAAAVVDDRVPYVNQMPSLIAQ
jgi:hypothetical protein